VLHVQAMPPSGSAQVALGSHPPLSVVQDATWETSAPISIASAASTV
jgi:hypothetical protein